MSEVNGKTLSISFRIDEGVIEHNNRIFIANIVNGEQVQENITYNDIDRFRQSASLFTKFFCPSYVRFLKGK